MFNNREYQKTYISTGGTTTVFTGKGILGGVVITTTSAGAITLYDNSVAFAVLQASILPGEYVTNVDIGNTLMLVNTATPCSIVVKWCKD